MSRFVLARPVPDPHGSTGVLDTENDAFAPFNAAVAPSVLLELETGFIPPEYFGWMSPAARLRDGIELEIITEETPNE